MKFNKELQDELNAYKMFFSSKRDTLEHESSSKNQSLIAQDKKMSYFPTELRTS